jgi:hypothetical protein
MFGEGYHIRECIVLLSYLAIGEVIESWNSWRCYAETSCINCYKFYNYKCYNCFKFHNNLYSNEHEILSKKTRSR